MLVVRGATSDILAPECVADMRQRRPNLAVVEVPNRDHAPLLDEAEAATTIRAFLVTRCPRRSRRHRPRVGDASVGNR